MRSRMWKLLFAICAVFLVPGCILHDGLSPQGLPDGACSGYGPDSCPAGCAVCPPCEDCSSIGCRSREACNELGFGEDWHDSVRPNRN
ncbi:hypothetical protein JW721_00535 [Candidatus Micrarchaeota archaeon]|nr:hypothetical protein [Candidatus Micrarchaeota archaeon]